MKWKFHFSLLSLRHTASTSSVGCAPPMHFKCTKYLFHFPFLCAECRVRAPCTSIVVRKMINDSVKSFSVQRGGGGDDGNSRYTGHVKTKCEARCESDASAIRWANVWVLWNAVLSHATIAKRHCTDNIGSYTEKHCEAHNIAKL